MPVIGLLNCKTNPLLQISNLNCYLKFWALQNIICTLHAVIAPIYLDENYEKYEEITIFHAIQTTEQLSIL